MEPQRKPMTLELMISSLTGNEALSSLHMAATAVAISDLEVVLKSFFLFPDLKHIH